MTIFHVSIRILMVIDGPSILNLKKRLVPGLKFDNIAKEMFNPKLMHNAAYGLLSTLISAFPCGVVLFKVFVWLKIGYVQQNEAVVAT